MKYMKCLWEETQVTGYKETVARGRKSVYQRCCDIAAAAVFFWKDLKSDSSVGLGPVSRKHR